MKTISIPDDALLEIYFKNGVSVKGRLVVWDEDVFVLESDNKNNLIVNDPHNDIMMIKVIGGGVQISDGTMEEDCNDIPDEPFPPEKETPEQRLDRLVEERKKSLVNERKLIKERLTNPNPPQPIGTKYELPSFKK